MCMQKLTVYPNLGADADNLANRVQVIRVYTNGDADADNYTNVGADADSLYSCGYKF